MFEYFPNNYTWSLAVMSALNRGGQVSEVDEACRPLREIAGTKALQGDQTQQRAWFESWMKVAERVRRQQSGDQRVAQRAPIRAVEREAQAARVQQLQERRLLLLHFR